jgi:hypothetical protein
MRTHTRLILGALTAAIVLATAVGTASANRLSTSNRNFRATWSPLTFQSNEEGGITIACNVTLEGSFHYASILKVARSLIGYVTKANVAHPCTGSGEAWADNGIENAGLGVIANSLPWHVTYEGFEGTLPNIGGVRLLLHPRFTLRTALTGLCKYEGNAQGVVKLGAGGVTQRIAPDPTVGIGKISGGFFCPGTGFFGAATGTVTLLGTNTPITITLI